MSKEPTSLPQIPDYVADLQTIYGVPSQAGFGSAVFYKYIDTSEQLEQVALKTYRYFIGDLWKRWGETAWMTPWKLVYQRDVLSTGKPMPNPPQIITEMQTVSDADTAISLSMILTVDHAEAAHQALSATYDDATVTDLVIYTIGDGGAMSGVLIAGRRESGETTLLIFLLD